MLTALFPVAGCISYSVHRLKTTYICSEIKNAWPNYNEHRLGNTGTIAYLHSINCLYILWWYDALYKAVQTKLSLYIGFAVGCYMLHALL